MNCVSQSKPATSMGLAVEIRLRIYEYLLTPYCTTEDLEELRRERHHCGYPRERHRNESHNTKVTCTCRNKHVFPPILSTCKQIFNEAAQILYENVELCVRLPQIYGGRRFPLCDVLEILPEYAPRHIKRMVIVGTTGEASEKHRDVRGAPTWRYPLEQCCKILEPKFPNLQNLRLCIDFEDPKRGRRTAIEQLVVVATLPRLVKIEIQKDQGIISSSPAIKAAIESKATELGRENLIIREIEHFCLR